MKTTITKLFRKWGRTLILFVSILWLCSAAATSADTLKMKDGGQLDGDIVSEDDQIVVIELSFAQGTMTTQRTYSKSDIAEIVRTPPEVKRKQKMEYWYGRLTAYQLNPKTSFAVSYYDSVITGVFKRYLSTFPESPNVKQINNLVAQWQAERDKVAAGNIKRDGNWMTSAEAEQWSDEQKALGYVERARSLLASKDYRLAWAQLVQSLSLSKNPDVLKEVGKTQNDIYFKYVDDLLSQQSWLSTQINYQEERVARADVSATSILQQGVIIPPTDDQGLAAGRMQRASVVAAAVQTQASQANLVLQQYKQQLAQVEDELQQLRQKKAEFDAGQAVGGMKKVN